MLSSEFLPILISSLIGIEVQQDNNTALGIVTVLIWFKMDDISCVSLLFLGFASSTDCKFNSQAG